MIGWFAAHKAVTLLGAALLAVGALWLAKGRRTADTSYGGLPVDPYSSTPPAQPGGGLSLLPMPAPLQDPEPGGPAPGPQPDPAAAVPGPGPSGAQVSTGPGAGPTMAMAVAPMPPVFAPSSEAPAFGTLGDLPAFQPTAPGYNPVYTNTEVIQGNVPVALVGTSGTVSDVSYAPGGAPRALSSGSGGVVALVDPSGHVVNPKGARVGGVVDPV